MREPNARSLTGLLMMAALVLIGVGAAHKVSDGSGEWRIYGGTNANLKYAPLDQIDAENFEGKQYIVVATGWKNTAGEFVALSLP